VRETVEADALSLPFSCDSFDVLTVAYGLRNMADWDEALREMRRVLRPGGILLVLDFSLPPRAPLRSLYRVYLQRILPRIAGWIAGNRQAYEYLAESIGRFPAGAEMEELLRRTGYEETVTRRLTGGISSLYTARKPVGEWETKELTRSGERTQAERRKIKRPESE